MPESEITGTMLRSEATHPASHREFEAMARRRSQHPKAFKEGNYWWLRIWDPSPTGSRRKLLRVKLAEAGMAVREVQKIVDEKLRPINEGTELRGSAMKFGDFMDQIYIPRYLREAETGRPAKLASTTRASYKYTIEKYLRPEFGGRCLRDLTQGALEDYFAALNVSYPILSKNRDALSSILRAAVKAGDLSRNPIEGLELPKDRRGRRPKPTITPEQFANLIEAVSEPYATMIFTAVWTGLRISELIGLKWRCIHADSITIEERYCRGDWSAPKTEASAATIGVDPEVIARLLRLPTLTVEVRAGRAIRKHKLVKSGGPDDLVFQSVQDGRPMNDQNILKRHLQPAARKLGLPFVNWRCLRTSHATWLVQSGADPKSVQGQMRHSRISTTMEIYAQIVPAAQRRALQQLSAFAGGGSLPAPRPMDLDLDFSESENDAEESRCSSRYKTVQ
jgi:integrase